MNSGTDLDQFITAALNSRGFTQPFVLGLVGEQCALLVAQHVGFDLTGYARVLVSSEVRHVFRSHGDAAREAKRGQKRVRKADFGLINRIADGADAVQLKGELKSNRPRRLVYVARVGEDWYEYVETIHPDRAVVALKTMRKW